MTRRRAAVVGLVGLATMAMAASVAWACTAISAVYSINPDAAPAGTTVVVSGAKFHPRAVEIRWNSLDGPVIGTTRGPDFEAEAVIPSDAAPGHYRVYATQEGSLNPEISFRVLPAASAVADHHDEVALDQGGPPPPPPPTPEAHPPAYQAGSESSSGPASESSSTANSGSSSSGRNGSSSASASSRPPGPPSPPASGGGGPSANVASPGAPVANAGAVEASPADTAGASHQPDGLFNRSAAGEVSFATAWKDSAGSGVALDQPAIERRGGSAMGVGVGFLALGLAALAGATVFGLRRRAHAMAGHHFEPIDI